MTSASDVLPLILILIRRPPDTMAPGEAETDKHHLNHSC